jgi:hypothetical protein
LVRQLPRDAAVQRSVYGELVEWGPLEHLVALVVDVLQAANWQRSGNRHAKRPRPLPRPGMPEPAGEDHRKPKARPIAEMRELLADWNTGKFDEGGYRPKGERRVM